jgi:hypothetical protein
VTVSWPPDGRRQDRRRHRQHDAGRGDQRQGGLSLNEIVTKARHVDELAAEVANASKEQSQGIDQINRAVGEMDKVTQSNAAGAEESASASEELSAQAELLKEAAGELPRMVDGSSAAPAARPIQTPAHTVKRSAQPGASPAVVKHANSSNGHEGHARHNGHNCNAKPRLEAPIRETAAAPGDFFKDTWAQASRPTGQGTRSAETGETSTVCSSHSFAPPTAAG